jgi:hypothetical protein
VRELLRLESCSHVAFVDLLNAARYWRFPSFCAANDRSHTHTLMTPGNESSSLVPQVCNGLVLASDGKKMSKRLKNYPVRSLPHMTASC